MKLDETKLIDGVKAGLLTLLMAEDPCLGGGSADMRSLAARILELARIEGGGKALLGQYDSELDRRAQLLCSVAGVETKGKWARVARVLHAYQRALVAVLKAVEAGE